MDFTNSRLLAIFAHPDDESYIVGGTLALASSQGAEIHLVSATRGDKGIQHVEDPTEREHITNTRAEELAAACRVLGIATHEVWDFPDGSVDNLGTKEEELNKKIVEKIEKAKPNIIITFGPNGVSRHRDHIAIGKIVHRLLTLKLYNFITSVYGVTIPRELITDFEQILSTRKKTTGHYHEIPLHGSPSINDVERVDIASTLATKFAACRAHASQNPEGLIASFEKLPPVLQHFEYFLPLRIYS